MIRPEFVAFLKENISRMTPQELRETLSRLGVSDLDFQDCMDAATAGADWTEPARKIERQRHWIFFLIVAASLACLIWLVGEIPLPINPKPIPLPTAPSHPPPLPLPKAPTIASLEETAEGNLRGVVYNLVNLQPIGNCAITFNGKFLAGPITVATDSLGRYHATIPFGAGRKFSVTVRKSGYAEAILNPLTEGVAEFSLDQRWDDAVDLLSLRSQEPWQLDGDGLAPQTVNFYLAPKSPGLKPSAPTP